MALPDPGTALHIATLDYYCTFSQLAAASGPVTFSVPDPVRFNFAFETGSTPNQDGSETITSDSSWFDQAATETGIAAALDAICAAVGTLLGLATGQVQAAVTVRRAWTIAPNVQGGGVSSGRTVITEAMPYPAA